MAVARYFKENTDSVALGGVDSERTVDADGNVTWTTTADGGQAVVKWSDRTKPDQMHPPGGALKAGSKVTKLKAGGYEIEERT